MTTEWRWREVYQRARQAYAAKRQDPSDPYDMFWISTTAYTVCREAVETGVITPEEYDIIAHAQGDHFHYAGD